MSVQKTKLQRMTTALTSLQNELTTLASGEPSFPMLRSHLEKATRNLRDVVYEIAMATEEAQ